MFLKINKQTLAVAVVPTFESSEFTNNGSHAQLSGHILAEVELTSCGANILLSHDATRAGTGRFDVGCFTEKKGVRFCKNQNRVPVCWGAYEYKTYYPDGYFHALTVVNAVEEFLRKHLGGTYRPVMADWLMKSLCQLDVMKAEVALSA